MRFLMPPLAARDQRMGNGLLHLEKNIFIFCNLIKLNDLDIKIVAQRQIIGKMRSVWWSRRRKYRNGRLDHLLMSTMRLKM
jgi:hypothetical protein